MYFPPLTPCCDLFCFVIKLRVFRNALRCRFSNIADAQKTCPQANPGQSMFSHEGVRTALTKLARLIR